MENGSKNVIYNKRNRHFRDGRGSPPPRCHATAVSARAQAQCARGAWALMLIQDAAGEEGRRLM